MHAFAISCFHAFNVATSVLPRGFSSSDVERHLEVVHCHACFDHVARLDGTDSRRSPGQNEIAGFESKVLTDVRENLRNLEYHVLRVACKVPNSKLNSLANFQKFENIPLFLIAQID